MDDRAWEPQPLLLCGGMGARPHACRDVGSCRHLDSSPRHRAREQDTVLPMLCACHPSFFSCLSPIQALHTGWHRSCSTPAHKKQPLRTTRRKAAYGLIALEALPPQTLPVLYTFRRRRVMAAVNYRTADVDGLTIFYREAGAAAAPHLLLLHGFPSASHMFRDLIPLLADRFHVLAPDLPGFGQSGMPPRRAFRYTFDNLAGVIDHLTQVVGLERFAVSVFDDGAPIGFRLAMRHPERITGIVSQNGNAYEEGLSDRLVTDAASCCLLGYAGATYCMGTMMSKTDVVVGIRRIGQTCPNTTPT